MHLTPDQSRILRLLVDLAEKAGLKDFPEEHADAWALVQQLESEPTMNRLSHTTQIDTRTIEQRAKDHARNLDVNAEPVALQRWAVTAKLLLEQLLKSKGNV